MKTKYFVKFFKDDIYMVIERCITFGKRLDAYTSEPDEIVEMSVYQGKLSDCESFIRLKEGGYFYDFGK